jgi:tRNA(Arg) A34 adenosine deaminase TadA
MCTGAIREAQLQKVMFAASDTSHRKLAPDLFEISGGLLEEEASKLIKEFFKKKRL